MDKCDNSQQSKAAYSKNIMLEAWAEWRLKSYLIVSYLAWSDMTPPWQNLQHWVIFSFTLAPTSPSSDKYEKNVL